MTIMFGGTICFIGLRSIVNISADQFVGIVMAVVLFWFGSRPSGAGPTTTTTTTAAEPGTATSSTEVKP